MKDVSVIVSSIRPEHWDRFYRSISNCKADFEVIFVGPTSNGSFPRCKYVQTSVKPAQCWHIAISQAESDRIFLIGDDFFFSENLLDKFIEQTRELGENFIVSCEIRCNGKPASERHYFFDWRNSLGPKSVYGVMFSKKHYFEVGGFDSSFIALYMDWDLIERLRRIGAKEVFVKDCFIDESCEVRLTTLLNETDFAYLLDCWLDGNKIRTQRKHPVTSFVDKDILTISQGPKSIPGREWV
ncbi:MAG: hypothetical protein WC346_03045 [Methanogenium sp.]|jgi:hypothetical protein